MPGRFGALGGGDRVVERGQKDARGRPGQRAVGRLDHRLDGGVLVEVAERAQLVAQRPVPASLGSIPICFCACGVEPGPEARDGRQVVGGDAGERQLGEVLRRRRLEVEQPVRHHPVVVQPLAHARLDGAEVLADDEGPRPLALQRDDGHQLVGARAHVAAPLGAERARDPEQPEQAHHVVDAQAAHVREHPADGLDERVGSGRRAAGGG